MAFDYASIAKEVSSLLVDFGQSVTLTNKSVGDYEVATGASTVTSTEQAAIGVVFDYGTKNIDGVLIKAGDKQLYIASVGISAPKVNDTITIGGVIYTITLVKSINPAGTPVLYECNIRS